MSRPPRVGGLVLCQRMHVDPLRGEISLVGVFNALTFARWPTSIVDFTAYAPLYGGSGEGTMKLVVTRMDTERDIYTFQRWYAAPGRRTVHLEVLARRCAFPLPGRYLVSLWFDEHTIARRYLDLLESERHP